LPNLAKTIIDKIRKRKVVIV